VCRMFVVSIFFVAGLFILLVYFFPSHIYFCLNTVPITNGKEYFFDSSPISGLLGPRKASQPFFLVETERQESA